MQVAIVVLLHLSSLFHAVTCVKCVALKRLAWP